MSEQGELERLRQENADLLKLVAQPTRIMFHEGSGTGVWLIPKNAHTSIERYCRELGGWARVPGGAVPDTTANIAVVRDPVDRYISTVWTMWHHVTPRNLNNPPTPDQSKWIDWEWFYYSVLEWNQAKGTPWKHFNDNHFRPQVEYLPPDRELIILDFKDVQQLPKVLQIHANVSPCPMPHLMRGSVEHKEMAYEMMESADRDIIRTHYAKDDSLYRGALG